MLLTLHSAMLGDANSGPGLGLWATGLVKNPMIWIERFTPVLTDSTRLTLSHVDSSQDTLPKPFGYRTSASAFRDPFESDSEYQLASEPRRFEAWPSTWPKVGNLKPGLTRSLLHIAELFKMAQGFSN